MIKRRKLERIRKFNPSKNSEIQLYNQQKQISVPLNCRGDFYLNSITEIGINI